MLRYIQPTGNEVNLDFLLKSTETMDFVQRLKGVKMLPATIMSYIKNMIRFIQYLKTDLNLATKGPHLPHAVSKIYRAAPLFEEAGGKVPQQRNSQKKVSCWSSYSLLMTPHVDSTWKAGRIMWYRKKVTILLIGVRVSYHSRYDRFIGNEHNLHDCQRLLRESKNDMLGIYGKLLEHQHVDEEQKTLFRYYCDAILILKHFQRPGAVEGMTVSTFPTQCFLSWYWVLHVVSGKYCMSRFK